jgi:lipopolysaccharide biosynthesis protein
MKAICFYLPQYHPIPENDAWWGEGFTEWRNVTKAVPNFPGHYQPHVPSELGFYDLRLIEVQRKQTHLAREHGIGGFCYHYYWFNGRRLLERPLQQLAEHTEIDFPFCVCWANENWTRTWDQKEKDVLLAQNHTPEDDEAFIRTLLPLLRDERYIRVRGKPLVAVYRVGLFPDARGTAERWRRIAVAEGLPGLHLCAVQFYGVDDPRAFGFDAAIEFPPHKFLGPENGPETLPQFSNPRFAGKVVDYQRVVAQALSKRMPEDYVVYRGVVPSWDNTARRQDTPRILLGATPLDFQFWLRRVVEQTRQRHEPEDQIVFINAWNEWGEGCHLEPDVKHGRAYLEATRAALRGVATVDEWLSALPLVSGADAPMVDEIRRAFEARERELFALQESIRTKNTELARLRAQAANGSANPLVAFARKELGRYPRLKDALKRVREWTQ